MKAYIDTCVWIDFVEGAEYAEGVFVEIIENEDKVFVSNFFFTEFNRYKPYSSIAFVVDMLRSKKLIEYVNATSSQDAESLTISKIRNIPFGDALHAVLARDNNAILITRDKHFLKLKDVCQIRLF